MAVVVVFVLCCCKIVTSPDAGEILQGVSNKMDTINRGCIYDKNINISDLELMIIKWRYRAILTQSEEFRFYSVLLFQIMKE